MGGELLPLEVRELIMAVENVLQKTQESYIEGSLSSLKDSKQVRQQTVLPASSCSPPSPAANAPLPACIFFCCRPWDFLCTHALLLFAHYI